MWQPETPYNDLPPLPPTYDIETRDILRKCISARAALAELKQAAELIPNQSMLLSTIPLMEAKASSEIENIVTTTDKLFQFSEHDLHADPATKEALRYRTALMSGFEVLQNRPLSAQTAIDVCRTIKGRDMPIRHGLGTALSNDATGQIIYTPPVGEAVIYEKLRDWEQFIHDDSGIDPLIRMAVAHYQFEAIHPFTDGNGRTGRVINSLFLIDQGLLNLPILYLSRFIIANKNDYYRLLLEVTTQSNWQEWIMFILGGIEETAVWTRNKIQAVRTLLESTTDYVRNSSDKIYSRDLIEIIFKQPYCRITQLEQAGLGSRQRCSRLLKALCDLNVLVEHKLGREKFYIQPKLLTLLTRDNNTFTPY
ncbi:Adenosine monophosphate-protein transferase SoFic [Ephemeroptericola cinctiostellae]|uniref:Adenosine monophosphate-protein transferase SoFic n=1 Tax=Ephemeroptericola cinctiostellae TaxID=2268024 RepID=A0A345DAL2_9BURK|nr:Fic family protein [Ephemeroptericola cinctiostellae]AXF85400.1 Adenosine monophosphate-protein transferase SoFic [Ephemeroptericola cinctiostellae]